jgi:hypothetical protein
MRDATGIVTGNGIRHIADLSPQDDVVSWSERYRQFQLAPTSGAYPKGKANLLRVITTQGEWYASEHHRVLCADGKYRQLASLSEGCELQSASPSQLQTSQELGRIWSREDDQHYWQKAVDSMGHCESLLSRYGQQLHLALNNAQSSPPLPADARKSVLSPLHMGGLELLHKHIHQGLFSCRQPMLDYSSLLVEIAEASEGYISRGFFARIYESIQLFLKYLQTLGHHQQSVLCEQFAVDYQGCFFGHSTGHVLALEAPYPGQAPRYSACSDRDARKARDTSEIHHTGKSNHSLYSPLFYRSLTKAAIITIEKQKRKEWFWDMHVAGNNNYVSEDGAIHHNSGKSTAGTMRLILLMLDDPGASCAYYMPSYDLLRLRAMPGIEEDLERIGLQFATNKSSYTISIKDYGDIIFRSYDCPERIIAYSVAHSIVDELDTLSKEKAALVWRKVSERNRQKRDRKNTIGLVTTPDHGVNGFVYDKWVKMKQPGYVLYKASTYSNPYLPKDYAEQILANYDPILAELYLNGDFVSLNQNKVYHFFDRLKHHTDRTITSTDTVIHVGLDFNIGGCCAVAFVIDDNNPIAVDEFTSYDTRDFVNNLSRYRGKTVIVYPDASGGSGHTNAAESDISIIKRAGYQVSANASNPAIRDRINAVNGLLAHDRLMINTSKCQQLTNALETQGYNERGEPEKFNNHPAIDDWVDGAGYLLAYRFPVRGNEYSTAHVRGALR